MHQHVLTFWHGTPEIEARQKFNHSFLLCKGSGSLPCRSSPWRLHSSLLSSCLCLWNVWLLNFTPGKGTSLHHPESTLCSPPLEAHLVSPTSAPRLPLPTPPHPYSPRAISHFYSVAKSCYNSKNYFSKVSSGMQDNSHMIHPSLKLMLSGQGALCFRGYPPSIDTEMPPPAKTLPSKKQMKIWLYFVCWNMCCLVTFVEAETPRDTFLPSHFKEWLPRAVADAKVTNVTNPLLPKVTFLKLLMVFWGERCFPSKSHWGMVVGKQPLLTKEVLRDVRGCIKVESLYEGSWSHSAYHEANL